MGTRLGRVVALTVFFTVACVPAGAPLGSQPAPASSPGAAPRASRIAPPTDSDSGAGFHRVLLEAEDFAVESGWRAIAVGEGNYMVDSIGASHVSGGRLLHAPGDAGGALARTDLEVPVAGRYKLWARYEYPYPQYSVPFEVAIEQGGQTVFRQVYGRREANRLWFFGKPDAPWQDFPHGVEGLVAEAYPADLAAGPAHLSLAALVEDGPQADRNVDFLFLTDDLEDTFRARGVRAYPLLDEVGWAASGRTFIRLTNPPEAGAAVSFEAQYAIN